MACKRVTIITAPLLAMALAACGSGPMRIDVSGAPGDLHFTLAAADAAHPACAGDLSVTPVIPDDADPAWQVSSLGPSRCFTTLRYGELTRNVTQRSPATPLYPDVAYRVRMSGPGFSAVRDFRITATGITMLD